jgi:dienelactone hydrolase
MLGVLLVVLLLAATVQAAAPRVLPEGKLPQDRRLGPLVDLNGYFPFEVPDSAEAWNQRAQRIRRQVKVATGIWPEPTRTPTNPVVHGKVQRDGYTVEKVYLESFPGHYVTGSLYRPEGESGPRPAVLCPHGHWSDGRFHDHGEKLLLQELVHGAERFEVGGRHPVQARCVQLVRMGCVVFLYDMVGYADSVQLEHRPGYREAMSTAESWGYFSPQAELRMQNMMGLQTWNSIRALDFLLSLPDVDDQRVAVTGASGGGTQTFILGAVDPRPRVAFPAVMVSTAMQGGCTCENACYLRVATGNVELAALFAPKPLGMSAADDWTKELQTKGLPQLKQLYQILGAADNVAGSSFTHFGHNYNNVSRAVMYSWMNRHLKLGLDEPIVEHDYVPLTREEASVWNEAHPRPEVGVAHERKLIQGITRDAQQQMAALVPGKKADLARYREVLGGAWDVMLGRTLPPAGSVEFDMSLKEDRGSYLEMAGLLRLAKQQEELPIVFLYPDSYDGRVVAWLDPAGKSAVYDSSGGPRPEVAQLLDAGCSVVGVDLLYQGEFLTDGKLLEQAPLVESTRWGYAGYTYGYNHSMFARRVHDVLTVLSFVQNHEREPKQIALVGLNGAAMWAAAAVLQSGDVVDRLAVDTQGFRFAGLTAFDDPHFLPGSVKYGDVPGLLSLCAPQELWIAGEGDRLPPLVRSVYAAEGQEQRATPFDGPAQDRANAAVTWLLEEEK